MAIFGVPSSTSGRDRDMHCVSHRKFHSEQLFFSTNFDKIPIFCGILPIVNSYSFRKKGQSAFSVERAYPINENTPKYKRAYLYEFWGQTVFVTRKKGLIDFHNEFFDPI